jgi:hypothetical protein
MILRQANTQVGLSIGSRDMPDTLPAGIGTTRPNVARVYDYWLGGKDNLAVDREQAERSLELSPSAAEYFNRSPADFASFFDDADVMPPGSAGVKREAIAP